MYTYIFCRCICIFMNIYTYMYVYMYNIHMYVYICIYRNLGRMPHDATQKRMYSIVWSSYGCKCMGVRKLNADPHAHELLKQLPALNPSWDLAGGDPGNQNLAIRKDLAARTWGVFWYQSKCPVLWEIMVQIKTKEGHGVKIPPTRSFWCGCVNMYT